MKARLVVLSLLLLTSVARAQMAQPVPVKPVHPAEPVPPPLPPGYLENQREETTGSGPYGSYRIVYEHDQTRRTQLRFMSPEPMSVRVMDGSIEVLRDTIPTKLDAKPGRRYRVQISNGREIVFDQQFDAKDEMVGQLYVTVNTRPVFVPPPPTPQPMRPSPVYPPPSGRHECMNGKVLQLLTDHIRDAANAPEKIWYVADITRPQRGYYFCVSQVFATLKLMPTPRDQMEALTHMSPLIVDHKNDFKIPLLFKTDNERDEVRRILAHGQQ